MGVISVKGPQFGQSYSVNISGNTPNPEEQSRINQFVSQQEVILAQRIEDRFGPSQQEQVEEAVEPEPEGGFGTAVGLGFDALQKAYGSSLEGIGSISGLQGLQDFGSSVVETNEQQIAEKAQALTKREDIDTVGETASFFFETLGQQVPQLGVSLAGGAAGAAIGSAVGPVGTAIGALVGGAAANIPYFYGDNREAQKEAIDRGLRTEMDEGTAFLSALPQAALDSIVDRLLIGKVLNPAVIRSGGVFTRAAKGVGAGTVAEVPTEIGQEVINRYQAGLPIDDAEAMKVYEDVAIAAGITGGTVRGTTNVIGGDIRKEKAAQEEQEKFAELQEDAEEESARTQETIARINESELREDEDITVEPTVEVEPQEMDVFGNLKQLALPSPSTQENDRLTPEQELTTLGRAAREATLPFNPVPMSELPLGERQVIQNTRRTQGLDEQQPASLDEIRRIVGEGAATREATKQKPVSGGTSRFQPVENKTFTQDQYDRAVEEIKSRKKYTEPAIQKAVRATGVKNVSRQVAKDIRDEMVNRGILRRTQKGYDIEPDVEAVSDEIASYRSTLSNLNKDIYGNSSVKRKKGESTNDFVQRKTGLVGLSKKIDLDARRALDQENDREKFLRLTTEAQEVRNQISEAQQVIAETEGRINSGPQSVNIPSTEKPRSILPSEVQQAGNTEGQVDALRQSVSNYDRDIKLQKQNLAKLKKQSKKVALNEEVQGLLSDIESDIETKTYLRDAAQARLTEPSAPVQVSSEQYLANKAREIANRAVNTTRKDSFNAKRQQVFTALRKRLNNLNLPDVKLTAERLVAPELLQQENPELAEGVFDFTAANKFHNTPSNRVISLSMEVADPSKSAQEQFDILKGVMNHEVIHALKSLGLFSDAEWSSLTGAVKKRKYVQIKNGKPVERKYTYLDRATAMYAGKGLNSASTEEEAIAEMFRDYADGKIKVIGRPKTLFERIKNFFSSIFKANQDVGINSVEDIFNDVRSGNIGKRDRLPEPDAEVTEDVSRQSIRNFDPKLPVAPQDARAHKLPYELLIQGNGSPAVLPITQAYTPANSNRNNSSIEQIIANNPDAMMSVEGWMKAMQEGLGGDYLPAPPLVAINYSQNPQVMADKLKQLTPELKKGVDEGFEFVDQIREIYQSGESSPRMTMDLFVWGILSRGAGPVQQEGAFIDIIDSAYPILEKATREPLTDDDVDRWMTTVSSVIPEGSPGKQVTMNVNAAAKLVKAMSQLVGDSNQTVIDVIHEGMTDPNVSASDIREAFLSGTKSAGIDNKVLSFILLVGGKDDVLVMDRIQGRHLWDDGRYGGSNIYDGIGPNKEGLNGIFRGPRGILTTRLLEDGMRKNVQKAYELAGRPEDASLGRWHWETWVIEGEQVVNHGTLQAIINGSPIGTSVTEGKTDTFSSGMTYIRGQNAPVVRYPLSDGGVVYMSPTRMKEFEAFIKKPKNGIIPRDFKVTGRADIPWFERKEVNRNKLDETAREYEDAKPNGSILRSDERTGELQDASQRGNSPIDRRYSLGFLADPSFRSVPSGSGRGRDSSGSLAPLEGAPTVQGATGPDEKLVAVAEQYALDNGIDLRRQSEFVIPNVDLATRIAQAYEDMDNAPEDPVVREAYENLVSQTIDQYRALENAGYRFWFTDVNIPDNVEYLSSPFNAMRDIRANKTMGVFPTDEGYGSGEVDTETSSNPMMMDTGIEWPSGSPDGPKKKVVANDLFRAVHDAFGHGLEGSGFRATGEENAWQAHVRLFTGSAVAAITSETRGQNSWLNFGPYGEQNRDAKIEDTIFADQKIGLMPSFTWEEGRAGSVEAAVDEDTDQTSTADELPAVDRSAIEQLLSGQDLTTQRKFSVSPSNADQLVAAPVKNKNGSSSPVFGSMIDSRGTRIPIVLPAGEHRRIEQREGATEVGRGLYHIQQRGHDRELLRFSNGKYNVLNAMYDLLKRWDKQGNEDGENVISYPSQGGIVLEWRNDIPFKAPPMKLVLKPRKLGSGYIFDIQTFFPDLEKKDRAVVDGRRRYSVAPSPLNNSTIAGQINQKEVDINYARSSDFIAKGLGRIVGKDKAQAQADSILTKFQDSMLPVGRMIQELKAKGLTIVDAMDTYLKEELYHGIVGNEVDKREKTIYQTAREALKNLNITKDQVKNLRSVSDAASESGRGFISQAIETSGSDRQTIGDAYLYAKHAKERNAYVRSINPDNNSGSGMSDAEADAILIWFSRLDNQNSAALGALDRAVRNVVRDTNNTRTQGGLIPAEFNQVELEDGTVVQKSNYNSYVPLRGKIDPDNETTDPSRPSMGAPFGARGREDRRVTGRYDYATDILATTLTQNMGAVARSERNKVGQSFLELLRSDPAVTKEFGTILKALPKTEQLRGGKVVRATDQRAYLDPLIYTVKENGQDVYVRLEDERIAKALKGDVGLGSSPLAGVVRGMGKINRYLSSINTSYNPEFFVTNLLRDLQTAGVNINQYDEKAMTTEIMKGVAGALKGIKRSIINSDDSSDWSKYYKDFVEAGGQNATNQMSTIADQMENIQGLLGDISDQGVRGKWNSVKNSFIGKKAGSLLSTIESYNTVIENGIRVSTYKAMLDRGFSRERAAQAARNVTVNFAKGGEYKTFMNAFYLFYNASLQGSFALLNAALKSKKVQKIWAGTIAAGFLQDQLNGMLSDEDEDGRLVYDKIQPYILEHNLILPDPFGFTERSYIAIPMPYGLNMAHNIGRATSQTARGGTSAGKATSSIVGTIVDVINPIGGTESFTNFAAPTILDPFIDVIENEDYAKKPVYKEAAFNDRGPDSQRYWSTTNPSAIWVTNMLNNLTGGTPDTKGFVDVSPDVMNFWLEYATGGVGRFVQRTAELPVRVYEEGLDEDIFREIPFVRKIIGSVSSREDYGNYIEKRDKVLVAGDEIKGALSSGDTERLQKARQRYSEEIKYLPRIKAIDNALRKVSGQMNSVRGNMRMPDDQKKLILDRLDERKQLLIGSANKILAGF